jgi:hypothetical protein
MVIGLFTTTTVRRFVVATLVVGGALVAGVTPAAARWQVHNSADVSQIVAPADGTEQQTCTESLNAQSGWSTSVPVGDDPSAFAPPEGSTAYGPLTYDIWKAPAGYTAGSFDEVSPGVVNFFPDGSVDSVPAIFVRQYTTPSRVAITPEYLYPDEVQTDPGSSNLYLFSFVAWNVLLPGVAVGDLLGMKPHASGATFVDVTAIHCDATKLHLHFVRYNPPGPDTNTNSVLNQEIVVIVNGTAQAQGLGGWTLRDKDGHVYRFPATRLDPGQSVTVHTGSGTNRLGQRYWGLKTAVWDNGGEQAVLRDGTGALVDVCRWGAGPGYVNC